MKKKKSYKLHELKNWRNDPQTKWIKTKENPQVKYATKSEISSWWISMEEQGNQLYIYEQMPILFTEAPKIK